MTRSYGDRGQGRKSEPGHLIQVQIRVESPREVAAITSLSPRQRTTSMLAPQHIVRTGERLVIRLIDPLPCAVRNDDRGTCGNDAYAAHADAVDVSGQWSTPGQWILQPICEECTKKIADMYK